MKHRPEYLRIMAITVVAISANVAIVFPAHAQSSACIKLQNQLSALDFSGTNRPGPSPRYRQYDRAVKDQQVQIDKTRRMARRNGCNGNFFNRRNTSTCGRILASLDKMSGNLATLKQERQRLAPRNTNVSNNQQRSIIRAMNRRGCFNNNNGFQATRERPRRRSLVEQIFGVRTFGDDGRRGLFEQPDFSMSSRYNTYRTMCVREMDGYYFPISFSTTPERFEFDERVCQSKCPGTNVSLYFHAMPTQDSEDMVSFRGQIPYADLPAAFAYRKKFNPKATCKYTSGIFEEITSSSYHNLNFSNPSNSTPSRIGTPNFRGDRSLDPETIANQSGLFSESEITRLFTSPEDIAKADTIAFNGRRVRIVGPAFFAQAIENNMVVKK